MTKLNLSKLPVVYIADAEFGKAAVSLSAEFVTESWPETDWVVKNADGATYIIRHESDKAHDNQTNQS